MLNNLRLAKSGTFLIINRPISSTLIEKIFREVSANKIGNYKERTIKQSFSTPLDCKVSFLVFEFEDEPSFLANTRFKENKFAFLILVEFQNYLIIGKKHVAGIEKYFEDHCSRLKYETIQYLFSDQDPSYEKMALSYMGISRSAILRKTLESTDLKGQLGAQSSRRSIPTSTTVKTREHRHILRPSGSSIAKSDSKSNILEYLSWLHQEIVPELEKENQQNTFLDSFAQPVPYDIVFNRTITPSAVLFNITEIKELLTEGALLSFRGYQLTNSKSFKLLENLEKIFLVEDVGELPTIFDNKKSGERFPVGHLKINPKSITIYSEYLQEVILVTDDGVERNLQTYFSNTNAFLVTFTSPEYIYVSKNVFRDKGISSHCAEIETTLTTCDFSNLSSEKGEPILATADSFSNQSVFHFYENNLKSQGSVLICDDLGDEWADYIEFSEHPPRYKLVHCKFGAVANGASQFHIVVAQALKNLGRALATKSELEPKIATWDDYYSGSRIYRVRSEHTIDELSEKVGSALDNPDCIKEVILVLPSLSKASTISAFNDLIAGRSVPHHLPQLIWLFSGFIVSCKEIGIKPVIYCSP